MSTSSEGGFGNDGQFGSEAGGLGSGVPGEGGITRGGGGGGGKGTGGGKVPSLRSAAACSFCRKQKMKCDGVSPCKRCRAAGVSCVFDLTSSTSRNTAKVRSNAQALHLIEGRVTGIEDRLDHLEYGRPDGSNSTAQQPPPFPSPQHSSSGLPQPLPPTHNQSCTEQNERLSARVAHLEAQLLALQGLILPLTGVSPSASFVDHLPAPPPTASTSRSVGRDGQSALFPPTLPAGVNPGVNLHFSPTTSASPSFSAAHYPLRHQPAYGLVPSGLALPAPPSSSSAYSQRSQHASTAHSPFPDQQLDEQVSTYHPPAYLSQQHHPSPLQAQQYYPTPHIPTTSIFSHSSPAPGTFGARHSPRPPPPPTAAPVSGTAPLFHPQAQRPSPAMDSIESFLAYHEGGRGGEGGGGGVGGVKRKAQ